VKRIAAAVIVTLAFVLAAHAQTYPVRPIRFVVPFAPGGSSEIVGRSVAAEMSKILGQQVYVENKPGAAGNIAMAEVAKAEPDGYTLILGHIGTLAVNPYMFEKLPYDPDRDFIAVSLLAIVPSLFVVNASLPARDLKEFVKLAQASPGKLTYGSAGNGVQARSSPICSAVASTLRRQARRRCCRTSRRASCAQSRSAHRSALPRCRTYPPSRSRAIRDSRPRSGTG
jgi:tripartite-type tricarboxylate transporter receptor subunit TctC